MTTDTQTRPTPAFLAQAVLSFVVAAVALAVGIARLPVDAWMRGFLAIGALYIVTSAFTLAKCVRDQQAVRAA